MLSNKTSGGQLQQRGHPCSLFTWSKSTESPKQEFRSTRQFGGGSARSRPGHVRTARRCRRRSSEDRGPIRPQVVRVSSSWNVTKSKLGTALFHRSISDVNNVKSHIYQGIRIGYYFCHLKKCLSVLNLGT